MPKLPNIFPLQITVDATHTVSNAVKVMIPGNARNHRQNPPSALSAQVHIHRYIRDAKNDVKTWEIQVEKNSNHLI